MSQGAYLTEKDPCLYKVPGTPHRWHEGRFLISESYGLNEQSAVDRQLGLSQEQSKELTVLMGAVLMNLQRASIVPIDVARAACSRIWNDNGGDSLSGRVTTLSPKVAKEAMKWSADTVIAGDKSLVPEAHKPALLKAHQEISATREQEIYPFSQTQPTVMYEPDESSNLDVELGQAAQRFVDTLGDKNIEAVRKIVSDLVTMVFTRSTLSFARFAREVGNPALLYPDAAVGKGKDGEVFVGRDYPRVEGTHSFRSLKGVPTSLDLELRHGTLPKDAVAYTTLNPYDLLESARGHRPDMLAPLFFANAEQITAKK